MSDEVKVDVRLGDATQAAFNVRLLTDMITVLFVGQRLDTVMTILATLMFGALERLEAEDPGLGGVDTIDKLAAGLKQAWQLRQLDKGRMQ